MIKAKKSIRLPAYVKPEHYLLTIKPDLENFTFSGEEVITLSLGRPVKEITLHSKELNIESVEIVRFSAIAENLTKKTGKEKIFAKISYNEKMETATFRFEKIIPKGKAQLRIVFCGILNDKLRGFYKSTYVHEGKEKHLATTQFEATDARRAFPSFDEPAHKAVFEVNLVVSENLTAISNTLPTEIGEHEAGYKIVRFAPTPKMSTYLLAFIVGDFEYVEKKTKSGVLVRIHTTPDKKHQAGFALDCAIRTLEFYNKYFAIPYPLNTLDMIAIPDFASGAMENWGAVTYRESALLVDETHSSLHNKQWVALVIAHELAHQWFGNLVTMEWWTHLWLNEGFASYIEYLAVDVLFPQWKIWQQFVTLDLGSALSLDALQNTHPIEVEVHHPDEIGEIFDAVSYSKGASVIRMLAGYLGEKDFRDGLRHYLKKHSYENASTVQLWKAFEKVSGKKIEKMMEVWTGKPGYPIVAVSENGNTHHLQQSRFFSSPISKKNSRDTTVWPIPLSVQSNTKKKTLLLGKKQEKIKLSDSHLGKWHKLNAGETSLARISYSEEMLKELQYPIASKKLSPEDRLGIIRDMVSLAEAGEVSSTRVLNMLESYRNEDEYIVWVEIVQALGAIYAILDHEPDRALFEKMAQGLLAPIGKKIGWQKKRDEAHRVTLLRSLILSALGKYRHKDTVAHAQKLFKNMNTVSPDIRGVVYSIVARYGKEKEYTALHKKYLTEELHEEKNRIGNALGAFRQPSLLKQTLAFSLSKNVRPQDTPSLIASVFANREGKMLAWQFVQKEWSTLLSRYGEGGHMLARLVQSTAVFNEKKYADEVKKFFAKHPAPGAERTITQVLEKILARSLFKQREEKAISAWLKNN